MFKRFKIYIVTAVAVMSALAMYAVGDATPAQTAQQIFTAVLNAAVHPEA